MKVYKLVETEIPDPVLPESVKNEDLDTIFPDQWRKLSDEERDQFKLYWSQRGCTSFVCLHCGYPTPRGQSGCEACK